MYVWCWDVVRICGVRSSVPTHVHSHTTTASIGTSLMKLSELVCGTARMVPAASRFWLPHVVHALGSRSARSHVADVGHEIEGHAIVLPTSCHGDVRTHIALTRLCVPCTHDPAGSGASSDMPGSSAAGTGSDVSGREGPVAASGGPKPDDAAAIQFDAQQQARTQNNMRRSRKGKPVRAS